MMPLARMVAQWRVSVIDLMQMSLLLMVLFIHNPHSVAGACALGWVMGRTATGAIRGRIVSLFLYIFSVLLIVTIFMMPQFVNKL